MLTYADCVNYLKKAYNGINGEINPVIPAIRLALTESNKDSVIDYAVVGTQCIMTVEIRLANAYTKFCQLGLTDNQVRGALLFIIAHELSHCDQKIIPNKLDDEYIMYMEYTNNLNTFRYLKEHENILQTYFGPYEIPKAAYRSYLEQKEYFKNQKYIFPQISSIKEKVLDGLSVIIGEDIYKTKYPIVNNINISIYVGSNLYDRFEIIKDKNLVCCHSNIFKLSQLIARGLYDYHKTYTINKDTCEVTLNLNTLPIYNVVVIG